LIELNIVQQSFAQGNEQVASVQWSCANRAQQPTVSNVTSLSSSWAFDHQLGSSSYTHKKTRGRADQDWNHPDVRTNRR
jgi:hypothetical protein